MRIYVHGWWAATAIIYLGLVFGRERIDIETSIDGSPVQDDSARARAEHHLFKSFDRARRLAAAFADLGDEQRDAALDFFALTCRAYDSYLEDWARHHAPRNGAGRLLARHALPLRESITDFLKWDPDRNDAHAVLDDVLVTWRRPLRSDASFLCTRARWATGTGASRGMGSTTPYRRGLRSWSGSARRAARARSRGAPKGFWSCTRASSALEASRTTSSRRRSSLGISYTLID